MVHALEKIHDLLAPGGFLIDIHPSGQPPPVTVRLGNRQVDAGWVREENNFIQYGQAEAAIETVVGQGLYIWERQATFVYTTAAPSMAELLAYLDETWQRAIIDESVRQRVAELMQPGVADQEVVISEVIRIGRLRPCASSDG